MLGALGTMGDFAGKLEAFEAEWRRTAQRLQFIEMRLAEQQATLAAIDTKLAETISVMRGMAAAVADMKKG